jgi:hypothetical protein
MSYSYSQTNIYHPFPDSNAIWIGEDQTFDGINCLINDHYNMYIDGDTTIGPFTYHKLFQKGFTYSNCPPPGFYYFNQLRGFFRQDIPNKKAYINYNGIDTLAYDFNLSAGDTLPISILNFGDNYVESVDSVLVGNSYRKMFWISNQSYTEYLRLIEGIGSDHGLLAYLVGNGESSSVLYCLYEDETLQWNNDLYGWYGCELFSSIEEQKQRSSFTVQPNPLRTSAQINIPDIYSKVEFTMFNIYGQKVKEGVLSQESNILYKDDLPCGLYVININYHNQYICTEKVIITE